MADLIVWLHICFNWICLLFTTPVGLVSRSRPESSAVVWGYWCLILIQVLCFYCFSYNRLGAFV